MTETTRQPDLKTVAPVQETTSGRIHVCLPPSDRSDLETTLRNLSEAFAGQDIVASTPDAVPTDLQFPQLTLVHASSSAPSQASIVPAAADYVNAWTAARDTNAGAIVVLGPQPASVAPATLQRLAQSVLHGQDLVVARYPTGLREGLINSSILYPLTRSLFSNPLRYPLPIDVALSPRMAERLATAGQHLTAANQSAAFIWPVAEAVFARCRTCDVAGDARTLPQPAQDDLGDVLATFVGSLFADAEAKAAFWQRAQLTGRSNPRHLEHAPEISSRQEDPVDPAPMMEQFRRGYAKFHDLWSLVMPPNSLLSLKKLSAATPDRFILSDALWARTVYDFLLAFRLRIVPREQLLAAFTPLYRAWAASHALLAANDAVKAEQLVERVALAFESDKPYLIARWRWPDRFNP